MDISQLSKKIIILLGVTLSLFIGLLFSDNEELQPLGASPTVYTITDASFTYSLDNENCADGETHGTVSDGAQGTVYYATCQGRSDQHIFSLSKTLTWESMGVDVGDVVSTVDGSFKYRQVQESHTDTQGTGRLEIWAGATLCATLETTIDPTPTDTAYLTHNATGAVAVDSACEASDTSIEIRIGPDDPMVETGNDKTAVAEIRWDDVSLTIVHTPPPPDAPTNVAATDGTDTSKVVVTWTKSSGATGYKVYEGSNLLDTLGDVATYDDTTAATSTITAGTATASDGTSLDHVVLSLAGESANNGTTRTYKVVATNTNGDSDDSDTDTGYRGVGSITYQWQVSDADSDASYSNISGGTTDPYNDTTAPGNGDGRYFKAVLDATGATQQISTSDRGYKEVSASPTTVLNTADLTDFGTDTTPTLEFTGTDGGGDDVEYNIQIDTVNTFDSLDGGYDETNYSFSVYSRYSTIGGLGQSFHGNGKLISSCQFYIRKNNSPTGDVTAYLYEHSGTFGTSGVPSGSYVAISDAIDISTVGTNLSMVEFIFSTPFLTVDGTEYVVVVEYPGGDSSNSLHVGMDDESSTHPGNLSLGSVGGSWSEQSTKDAIFYVFSKSLIDADSSVPDAGFANTVTPADTHPFNEGEKADYDVQSGDALTTDTYYWRVRAIDPLGSNVYGDWATTREFYIDTSGGGGETTPAQSEFFWD